MTHEGGTLSRRLIEVLRVLARELIEQGYDADDVVSKASLFDIDFLAVTEELSAPDVARHIDEAELDTIKVLLSYILIKESELDLEEIYTFVFGKGKQLVWH
jgi:predicted ABC-type ATPase